MANLNTVDTTRIPYDSPEEMSVAVSRMMWPTPSQDPHSPKVVILAQTQNFTYPVTAASLIHNPIMGDLLLTPPDEIPELIAEEIRRINPVGTHQLPPVILVGPFRQRAITMIETLGFGVLHINGRNAIATAVNVARLREEVPPVDGPNSVMIISVDRSFEGPVTAYYAAHSGVPVLLTHQGHLPVATARFLREHPDKTVYVVGGRRAISDGVIREIEDLVTPPVTRIAGPNAFATAVEFTAFHDRKTGFGWNRNKPRGDAFTFANVDDWTLSTAAANMAHQGKHTPLLLIRQDSIPAVVQDYLLSIKPPLCQPPMPPFMHGFILGTEKEITYNNQAHLELILKSDIPPAQEEKEE